MTAPPAEIRGATIHDQKWIDGTVEAGVQGLGWPRPGPRPPEWDAPAPKPPAIKPQPAKSARKPIAQRVEKPAPKPQPRWLQMLRRKETS